MARSKRRNANRSKVKRVGARAKRALSVKRKAPAPSARSRAVQWQTTAGSTGGCP
jgi:hypothetical protein